MKKKRSNAGKSVIILRSKNDLRSKIDFKEKGSKVYILVGFNPFRIAPVHKTKAGLERWLLESGYKRYYHFYWAKSQKDYVNGTFYVIEKRPLVKSTTHKKTKNGKKSGFKKKSSVNKKV